jgi:hypothetical protein
MIFEATAQVTAGSTPKATSRLLLRKWLKMLIDRSLVLGSVDKPQLHDIVLEFVIGQFAPEELKEAHRRLIRVFQRDRPIPSGWVKMNAHDDALVTYITHEIGFHVAQAWSEPWDADVEGIGWTEDLVKGHTDMIAIAACNHLGADRLRQLAVHAEEEERWWSAAIRWMGVGEVIYSTGDAGMSLPVFRHAAELISNVVPIESASTSASSQYNTDRFELSLVLRILKFFDKDDFATYEDRVARLATTQAGTEDPLVVSELIQTSQILGPMVTIGDLIASWKGQETYTVHIQQAADDHAETPLGRRCFMASLVWTCNSFDYIPTWTSRTVEEVFGVRGSKVVDVYAMHTLQDHHDNVAFVGWDPMMILGNCGISPLLYFWGEVDKAIVVGNKILTIMNEAERAGSATMDMQHGMAIAILPWSFHLIGENALIFEWMKQLLGTFDNIVNVYTNKAENWPLYAVRAPIDAGLAEAGPELLYVEHLVGCAMTGWLLTCPKDSIVDPDAYLAKLPDPAEFLRLEQLTRGGVSWSHPSANEACPLMWAARANERFGFYERGLTYTDMFEEFSDQSAKYAGGRDPILWYRSLSRSTAGRMLAHLGRTDEAAAKFEAAVDDARAHQYVYLEALAIQDWIKHVLEPAGRAAEAAAPLAAAMETLGIGRREQVTELMASYAAL